MAARLLGRSGGRLDSRRAGWLTPRVPHLEILRVIEIFHVENCQMEIRQWLIEKQSHGVILCKKDDRVIRASAAEANYSDYVGNPQAMTGRSNFGNESACEEEPRLGRGVRLKIPGKKYQQPN